MKWIKGAPPFGVWVAYVQWDEESLMMEVVSVGDFGTRLYYQVHHEKEIQKEMITEYLDMEDHSDEEAAFNAAREMKEFRTNYPENFYNELKYPTFTDYLKSKQEL